MKNSKEIYNQLLEYLQKEQLKSFELEINQLFKIKENRNSAPLLNLQGLFFEIKKDFEKSFNYFLNSIKLDSNFAPSYFNLARLYFHFKMYKPAINFFERYLHLNKNGHYDADFFLSKSYYCDYQYDKARILLEQILEKYSVNLSDDQHIETLNLLGSCLISSKKIDEALNFYNKALEVDPNNILVLGNVANALRSQDKIDEATQVFNKCLKINPKNPDIHKDLSVILKYKSPNDVHLKEMKNLYSDKEITEMGKSTLGFAIAKAYDDCKIAEEACKYLIPANEIRRKQFNYKFENEIDEFNTHLKVFSKFGSGSRLEKKTTVTPIFILGMPRSGSTLIEQILSSHSLVEGGDEVFFLAEALQNVIPHKSLAEFEEKINLNTLDTFDKISLKYSDELKKISNNKKFITDKMPLNFKLIGLIYNSIPNAKIIHSVRDGRDTCLSIFKNNFASDRMAWAYNQKELSNFFNLYVKYMKMWKKLYGDFIYDLNYENLIENTETEVKNLLKFCNLNFEQNCLNFYNNKRAVQTVSTMQVRQPIYKSSMQGWKVYESYLPELFNSIKNY